MTGSSHGGMAERILLSVVLPLGGMFTGFLLAGVGIVVGLPERTASGIAVLGTLLGVVAMSHMAPRAIPNASRFSVARRIVAGVVGFLAASAAGRFLSFLGLDVDALSYSSSVWAVAEEGLSMLLILGSMLVAGVTALGRPSLANDSVAR